MLVGGCVARLTYWGMAAPVLLLEFLVGKYAPKDFLAAATTATQG